MAEATATQCCRSCGTPLTHVFVDLGMSPVSNAMRHPSQARDAEALLSAQDLRVRRLQAGADRGRAAGGDRTSTAAIPISRRTRRRGSRMPSAMPRHDDGALQTWGRQSRVIEVREQRRLSPAVFPGAAAFRCSASIPAANCAEVAQRERASRRWSRFFGKATATEVAAEGKADVIAGNNVLAHVPDINDFVGGPQDPAEGDRRHHHRVSASPAAHREPTTSTPSITSTIRTCRCCRSSAPVRAARAHRVRCRGAHDARRQPAHLRRSRGAKYPKRERASRRVSAPLRRAARCRYAFPPTPAFAGKVREAKRALLSCLIKAQGRGQEHRRLRRSRQERHAAQLLRHPRRFPRLRRRRGGPHKQGGGGSLPAWGTALPVHAPERIFETKPDYVA